MTLIPDPVIGGLNAVLLGTLIAVGVATLRFVDMESPRNVTVIGLTFMLGLAIPQWVNAKPGRINTGLPVWLASWLFMCFFLSFLEGFFLQ